MSMDGRTDRRMEGRTDEPITIVPFDLHRGTIIDDFAVTMESAKSNNN